VHHSRNSIYFLENKAFSEHLSEMHKPSRLNPKPCAAANYTTGPNFSWHEAILQGDPNPWRLSPRRRLPSHIAITSVFRKSAFVRQASGEMKLEHGGGPTVDHHQRHADHHQKHVEEHHHQREERKAHEHEAEKRFGKPGPAVRPIWRFVVGILLTAAALIIWMFAWSRP